MLKEYPDVMSIEQMCEILCISTKTGYRILREGKNVQFDPELTERFIAVITRRQPE